MGEVDEREVYLGQDFLGESLGDLEKVGFDTSFLEAFLLGLSQLLDVAVHRVLRVH